MPGRPLSRTTCTSGSSFMVKTPPLRNVDRLKVKVLGCTRWPTLVRAAVWVVLAGGGGRLTVRKSPKVNRRKVASGGRKSPMREPHVFDLELIYISNRIL